MRKIKRKYERPKHPWEKERIETEKTLVQTYGFKNKTEIWKAVSKLKAIKDQAKKLIAAVGPQAELERAQLMARLQRYGLITQEAKLDDVLALEPRALFERRLQTLVFKKGLAKTPKQARQFIVHGHVCIGCKKICSPNYLVTVAEEGKICFAQSSPFHAKG